MKHIKKFESMKAKLPFDEWVDKYFDKDRDYERTRKYHHNYWTSNYEASVIGFAPSDQIRYREDDLEREYQDYLNDTNTFLEYDECTNDRVRNSHKGH
jgi:hypothetical protein